MKTVLTALVASAALVAVPALPAAATAPAPAGASSVDRLGTTGKVAEGWLCRVLGLNCA